MGLVPNLVFVSIQLDHQGYYKYDNSKRVALPWEGAAFFQS